MRLDDILKKLPLLDCGDCGFETCRDMAKEISIGKKEFQNCLVIYAGRKVEINVGGNPVPVGNFVQNLVSKTIVAMVSTLKKTNLNNGDLIEIKVKIDEDDLR
jgi:molybdopterin-guanine dinucleotide biosynthesis protein B|tara:strand:- start:1258 stop:1566 length:309 start_codon:yes stop_codon:yes gene_type:complete